LKFAENTGLCALNNLWRTSQIYFGLSLISVIDSTMRFLPPASPHLVQSLSVGTEGEGEWFEQRRRRRVGKEVRAMVQVVEEK
jgi:hypothetical protein